MSKSSRGKMKKIYFRFRVLLITFTLGLASVFMLNGSLQISDEIPINLPRTVFGETIVISPKYSKEITKIERSIMCKRFDERPE